MVQEQVRDIKPMPFIIVALSNNGHGALKFPHSASHKIITSPLLSVVLRWGFHFNCVTVIEL